MSLISVDLLAGWIFHLGQGTLMAKFDLESAYRVIPVHPDDQHLLGMMWQGQLYIDMTLPFGLRSAPKLFTAVADALEWVIRSKGSESPRTLH